MMTGPHFGLLLQWGPVVVTGISEGLPVRLGDRAQASMGSGRGDRNQDTLGLLASEHTDPLQWGPVVVTGIRRR